MTGLLGISGITANTYVEAAPTAAKLFGTIEKLLADTFTAYGAPVDTLVLHSRRARRLEDNTVLASPPYGATVLETMGVPTTLGAGTEGAAIALALQERPISMGPVQFFVDPGVLSNTLQVRLYAFAYVSMVGARLQTSIGKLTGTGFIPRRSRYGDVRKGGSGLGPFCSPGPNNQPVQPQRRRAWPSRQSKSAQAAAGIQSRTSRLAGASIVRMTTRCSPTGTKRHRLSRPAATCEGPLAIGSGSKGATASAPTP